MKIKVLLLLVLFSGINVYSNPREDGICYTDKGCVDGGGEMNETMVFAKGAIDEKDKSLGMSIASELYDRGYRKEALELFEQMALDDASFGEALFNTLVCRKHFQEAEQLANGLLEAWANETFVNDNILSKLFLAARIHDADHYKKILEKYLAHQEGDCSDECYILHFSDFLSFKKLDSDKPTKSIIDVLTSKLYFDAKFSEKYGINSENIQQLIESRFYEASKSHDIISNIFHSIALNVKNDPYFKFYILAENNDSKLSNAYLKTTGNIFIMGRTIRNADLFLETVVHEMSHKLMDILYKNDTYPYRSDDKDAKKAFREAVSQLEAKLDRIKIEYDINNLGYVKTGNKAYDIAINHLLEVKTNYDSHEYDCEYIVRYPQLLVRGIYEDPRVKELMEPLANYWREHVAPRIKKHIEKQSDNSLLVWDYERENIITSQLIELKKYELMLLRLDIPKNL